MSWTLGAISLPRPKSFNRRVVEVGAQNQSLDGTHTKRIVKFKEIFVLQFQALTQAEVSSILSEYEMFTPREFSVDENEEIVINPVLVHIDIEGREYNYHDSTYREDITMELTQVT